MNNEPVAYMVDTVITYSDDIAQGLASESGKPIIPLYTHSAKESDSTKIASEKEFWECYLKVCSENHPAKTLTDEEIWKELTTVKHTWIATTSVWFEFEKEELTKAIRAILKKANNG